MAESTDVNADNIFNTWHLYQKIVGFNNMFHKEIYVDVAKILNNLSNFTLLDLGCGDSSNMVPLLSHLPITHYCGIDLSATALNLARANLKNLLFTTEFHNMDLLHAVQTLNDQYDVIFTSFALHHLSVIQKAAFFKAARSRLKKGGMVLMIDVVREEQQDLISYLNTYCNWIDTEWQGINSQEKAIACQHIMNNDFPEMLSTLEKFAQYSHFSNCKTFSQYKWHKVLLFQGDRI